MKEIFSEICARLKAQVPALRWVDFDLGQLDYFETPPVSYPCVLLDIEYPNCNDLSDSSQQVDVRINLRIAFLPAGETNFKSPDAVKAAALGMFDTIGAIHTALQGWDTNYFSYLSRKSMHTEKRQDGIKVFEVVYESAMED